MLRQVQLFSGFGNIRKGSQLFLKQHLQIGVLPSLDEINTLVDDSVGHRIRQEQPPGRFFLLKSHKRIEVVPHLREQFQIVGHILFHVKGILGQQNGKLCLYPQGGAERFFVEVPVVALHFFLQRVLQHIPGKFLRFVQGRAVNPMKGGQRVFCADPFFLRKFGGNHPQMHRLPGNAVAFGIGQCIVQIQRGGGSFFLKIPVRESGKRCGGVCVVDICRKRKKMKRREVCRAGKEQAENSGSQRQSHYREKNLFSHRAP